MPVRNRTKKQMAARRPSETVRNRTVEPGANSHVERLLAALAVRIVITEKKESIR